MPRSTAAEIAQRAAEGHTLFRGRRVDPLTIGTWFGILSAVAYTGANVALRQLAVSGDIDWAVWVSCLKAAPTALAAWVLLAYRAAHGLPAFPPRSHLVPLLLTGLFMQFGGNVMFQISLSLGGLAVSVPMCLATLILSGAWLGRVVLSEPILPRSAAAMGVLILSITLLSFGAGDTARSMTATPSLAIVAASISSACLAGFAYGSSSVVIRRTVTRNVSLSATLMVLSTSGVAALGLTSVARLGVDRLMQTSASDLATMLTAGVLNAVAFFSVGAALKYLTVTRVNLLNASQAALAAILGVIWFDEPMTLWLVAGTVLAIAGLLLMEGRKFSARRAPLPSEGADTGAVPTSTVSDLPQPPLGKGGSQTQGSPGPSEIGSSGREPKPIFNQDRIQAETGVRQIDFHRVLPSTNRRALELAAEANITTPLLVLTELQTAGRGRGSNRWWSSAGALTFSLIVDAECPRSQAGAWERDRLGAWERDRFDPRVALAAGLAVCDALREMAPFVKIGLKWPNDVMLDGRKVCGILVEVPSPQSDRFVLGVGINVNNSLAAAPADLRRTATSLVDVTNHAFDLNDLLVRVITAWEHAHSLLAADAGGLIERCNGYCILHDRRVELDLGQSKVVGLCQGIDGEGAIVIETEFGPQRFFSGVVTGYE